MKAANVLTAQELLSATSRTAPYTITTEGPLKGRSVVLRVMSADGYQRWLTSDGEDSRAILLAEAIVEPEITPAVAEQLGGIEAPLIVELSNAALAFNGFIVGKETGIAPVVEEATGDNNAGEFRADG